MELFINPLIIFDIGKTKNHFFHTAIATSCSRRYVTVPLHSLCETKFCSIELRNVQECDTTDVDSGTSVGYIIFLQFYLHLLAYIASWLLSADAFALSSVG